MKTWLVYPRSSHKVGVYWRVVSPPPSIASRDSFDADIPKDSQILLDLGDILCDLTPSQL
ncbi:hypothetical protein CTAM01_16878 [Colletotrichum tamarilloi]|uniref:Uncharacterized protein n=1 Tax=Colletotrichum tamarilloi TaxID=1209934 RepID=A0ABQ9QH89_9PEZI|nr:uncharacterized protein CTAM01_16878 [Colletotrichum tamarilloi]KAK1470242.1 hypothetical protein CTAM01_16878 [Colletotrichum tamarilloi]